MVNGNTSKMTDSEKAVESALEAQRRAQNCLIDIQNVLKRWNCAIDPIIQISGQGVGRSYAVIPLMNVLLG